MKKETEGPKDTKPSGTIIDPGNNMPGKEATRLASLTISVAEAKKGLSELCARAEYARDTIVITRRGRPIAAIIGLADLERCAALDDQHAVELLDRAIATSPGTAKVKLRSVAT